MENKPMKKIPTQPVSIRFNKDFINHLKTVARKLSAKNDIDLTYSDLIRQSVEQKYPLEHKTND